MKGQPRVLACCGGMVVPGGAERMTFEVLRALRERGAAVHCVLNGWASSRIVPLVEEIGATWTAGGSRVRFDRRTRDPRVVLRQLWDVIETSWYAFKALVTFRPSHVVVPDHETVLRNFPALLCARLLGCQTIMKLCNAPVQSRFYRFVWRRLVNAAVGRFVCNSEFTRRELLAHGISEGKTSLIYETLPRREQVRRPEARDARTLVFVGQIIPDKGLHLLLDAVGLLVARGKDVKLDVVGDMDGWISPAYGDYRERLRARAAQPDLCNRVNFLGWRDDVLEVVAGAALLVCPSLAIIRESFGLVVLEAKSVGVPSVTFSCGALVEQISHGVDGHVCIEETADALASGISVFLDDPAALAAAGEAAQRSAAKFDRRVFVKAWQGEFGLDGVEVGATCAAHTL